MRQAAREGHTTAEALVARLELDDPSCCGRCARNIRQFVLLALDECAKPAAEASG